MAEHYGAEAPRKPRYDRDPNAASGGVGNDYPALWRDDSDERRRHEQAGNEDEDTPHVLPLPAAQKTHWQREATIHESG